MGPKEEILRHLQAGRNLSPHTVRAYGGDLERFARFIGGETGLLGPGASILNVRRYLTQLHSENYQKSSMARTLACLRTFYDYFLRNGVIGSNPVRPVRTPRLDKKLPKFLEEIAINGLALGDASVNLRLRRRGANTEVAIVSRTGDIAIKITQ